MSALNKRNVATLVICAHIANRTIEKAMGEELDKVDDKEQLRRVVSGSVINKLTAKPDKE